VVKVDEVEVEVRGMVSDLTTPQIPDPTSNVASPNEILQLLKPRF
jgi:hypothetical protein